MKKNIFIIIFLFAALSFSYAQSTRKIDGVVKNSEKKEAIPYASVYSIKTGLFTDCDENGKFSISLPSEDKITLVATAVGFDRDTVVLSLEDGFAEFHLNGVNELEQAVIQGKMEGSYLSKMTPVRTEVITAAGLCKMACCNLAESFENSASVTVGYSDAVTGAKQIRLLGLSGIYTQMLDENRPVMRGLASPFGLSYIPGQWLESIQIAKGPSSVINGVEAITGQINLEHRKPTAENPLFVNLFLSQMLRSEANIASSLQLNEKWSTVLLGHFSTDPMAHDGNGDGFRDEPTTMQFNFANRWLYYGTSGVQVRFGIRALSDDRTGGQMGYKKEMRNIATTDSGQMLWGSNIKNKGLNGYLKVGIPLNADNSTNIAIVADYTYHKIDSYFGLKDYKGDQNSVFVNLIYQNIPNDNHRFTFGVRNQFDKFNELLQNVTDLGRRENSVGVYGEYTFDYGDKLTAVADLSLDYNNIYGWLFAPRANIKYSFTDNLVARVSAGRGFRSPNVVVDNLGMLSTGRRIFIDGNPDIESAWTYGGNLTAYLPIGFDDNAYISFDYFRTDFTKQLLVDQERDESLVWLYNLDGRSYTNTYQADFSIYPFERFNILATVRYTDAKVTLANQGLVERPLTSRFKGVLNFQYATRMNIWTFDFTAQLNGSTRLPEFMGGGRSPVYPILFAQITRKFRSLDIYVGGENLTNYRQKNPILNADKPFSTGFNASAVWGPLMGVKVYAGMRLTLWK